MVSTCEWSNSESDSAQGAKAAITIAVALMFIYYTIFAVLAELKSAAEFGRKARQYTNEVAHEHLFFYMLCIMAHTLTPKEAHAIMIWVYLAFLVVKSIALKKSNVGFMKTCFIIETLILVVLCIMIMGDDWCRFYLYGGHSLEQTHREQPQH